MLRPSTARGMPALGMAARGSVVAARMASMAVSTVAGPVEQLTPMALGAPLGEQRRGLRGRGAIQAVALVVHGDHDQHGQVGSDFAGGVQGLVRLVQRGHGFDDQQVHAGLGQGANLLGKGGAGFVQAGFAQRLQAHAQRAHGAGDPGLAGLLFLEMLDGLAGQPHAGGVDFSHLAGQAVAGQPEAIGAKGVGFKNLRAGLQVLLVNGRGSGRGRRGSARRSSG